MKSLRLNCRPTVPEGDVPLHPLDCLPENLQALYFSCTTVSLPLLQAVLPKNLKKLEINTSGWEGDLAEVRHFFCVWPASTWPGSFW